MREEIKSKLEEILDKFKLDTTQFSLEMDNYNILLWYAKGIVSREEATNYFSMRARQGYNMGSWKSWFHQLAILNGESEPSALSLLRQLDNYKEKGKPDLRDDPDYPFL